MQFAQHGGEHSAYRSVMQPAYPARMASLDSPRQVRRRAKLKSLVGDDAGAQAQLARDVQTPRSHLSAILAGRRGIGDALAAKIERAREKPAGWFDVEEDTPAAFSPEVAQLAQAIDALPPAWRGEAVEMCTKIVGWLRDKDQRSASAG